MLTTTTMRQGILRPSSCMSAASSSSSSSRACGRARARPRGRARARPRGRARRKQHVVDDDDETRYSAAIFLNVGSIVLVIISKT
jgi:hypothetical protein